MRRLVLHHRYNLGAAFDVSGFGNHGRVTDTQPTPQGALTFLERSSRVDVPPSPSLRELGLFRCTVTFRLEPKNADARYNLVEAGNSFALYVDYDWTLRCTLYQGGGPWPGAAVRVPQLADGRWHRVDGGHDGLSTSWLAVDGQVATVDDNVAGPAHPLDAGLVIGHWPGSADQDWTFTGDIGEVWLWRWWPDPPFERCCADPKALSQLEDLLARHGIDRSSLPGLRHELWRIAARLHTGLGAGRRADFALTGVELQRATQTGNWPRVVRAARHADHLLRAALGDRQVDDAAAAVQERVAALLKDENLLDALDGLMCTPRPGPGATGIRPNELEALRYSEDKGPYSQAVDESRPEPGYRPGTKPKKA